MSALPPNAEAAIGEVFSRTYQRPDNLLPDSPEMRLRLGRYVERMLNNELHEISEHLAVEGGIDIPWIGGRKSIERYFDDGPLPKVLNAITLVWRYLQHRCELARRIGYRDLDIDKATPWKTFVGRVFAEESMGYRLDERCGVHFKIDAEFERVNAFAISGLGTARYTGVRSAFEQAQAYLDQDPPDTKASVRSAFEALEVLARLMVPEAQNLNGRMINDRLKPKVLASTPDPTEQTAVSLLLDGLGNFVNGVHYYRHGQGREDVVAPTLGTAVYMVSSIGSALRLLLAADQASPAAVN